MLKNPSPPRSSWLLVLTRWSNSPAGYLSTLALFLIAFAIRWVLQDQLPPGFPYLTFFPVVIVSALIFGTAAGVLSAVLSFFAAWYFFIPPFGSFSLSTATVIALLFFVFIVAIDILIIDRMRDAQVELDRSRLAAEALALQRDEMFKELQHRVGNNLNVVASLLSIQSRGTVDPAARQALNDASIRIHTIGDINRMFVDPTDTLASLDDRFVTDLASKCLVAAGVDGRARLTTDITPIRLPQTSFIPVALTIAESINNAIEHGIKADGPAEIKVSCTVEAGTAIICVDNDGRALPPDFDLAKSKSIGLTLIKSFARKLDGTYDLVTVSGRTVARLSFPLTAI